MSIKLMLLFTLGLLTLMSCGKEVDSSNVSPYQVQRPIRDNNIVLDFSHPSLTEFSYPIPKNAIFMIPESFVFDSQEILRRPVSIIFNAIPDSFIFEFRCSYSPDNKEGLFSLSICYDQFGYSLGSVSDIEFMLDKGKTIIIRSEEVSSFGATIPLIVDWR